MPTDTTYSHARANFAAICDEVVSSTEAVIIHRRGAQDVALISAAELRSLYGECDTPLGITVYYLEELGVHEELSGPEEFDAFENGAIHPCEAPEPVYDIERLFQAHDAIRRAVRLGLCVYKILLAEAGRAPVDAEVGVVAGEEREGIGLVIVPLDEQLWHMLDIPALRDQDAEQPGRYIAAANGDQRIDARGFIVYESTDEGSSWRKIAELGKPAVFGDLVTAPSSTGIEPKVPDHATTYRVRIVSRSGSPSSVDLQEIAAELALETPGIDALETGTLARGPRTGSGVTVGSTASIFEMYRSEACYLWEKELVAHAPDASANIVDPHFAQPVFSLPWGGTSLPVYFEHDSRVRSCISYVGFYDNNVMKQVHALGQKWEAEFKHLPREHQDA